MPTAKLSLLAITLVLTGLSAGFFFTWSFTVMRGLDAAPPDAAIAAMNAVNGNIRSAWFAAIFFGPALLGVIATVLFLADRVDAAALCVLGATLVYLAGVIGVTFFVNVPLNEALGSAAIPPDPTDVDRMWREYSGAWTAWNHLRTAAATLSLGALLAALRLA